MRISLQFEQSWEILIDYYTGLLSFLYNALSSHYALFDGIIYALDEFSTYSSSHISSDAATDERIAAHTQLWE